MFPYTFTLFAFFEKFRTDAHAVEYLIEKSILRETGFCDQCEKGMSLQKSTKSIDGRALRCTKCKRLKSIRSGTILEKSKITAREFLLFLYHWCNESSINQLSTYTGISRSTCVEYADILRDIVSWKFENEDNKLGGPGHIVQVDESVIYKAKYNRGHALFEPTKWVFGIYDITTSLGAVFFVPDRSSESLLPLIQAHIEPGSEIHSDQWRAYSGIRHLPVQPPFIHKTVNHSLWFKDPETEVHTNNIEAYWASVKGIFKRLRGTSRAKTASYLDLHMYKERYGKAPPILFDCILGDIDRKYMFEN
jgi:hypothetical protein